MVIIITSSVTSSQWSERLELKSWWKIFAFELQNWRQIRITNPERKCSSWNPLTPWVHFSCCQSLETAICVDFNKRFSWCDILWSCDWLLNKENAFSSTLLVTWLSLQIFTFFIGDCAPWCIFLNYSLWSYSQVFQVRGEKYKALSPIKNWQKTVYLKNK